MRWYHYVGLTMIIIAIIIFSPPFAEYINRTPACIANSMNCTNYFFFIYPAIALLFIGVIIFFWNPIFVSVQDR